MDLMRKDGLAPVLAMRPHYVEKLWGGARLAALPAKRRAGHPPPAGRRIGESWEVADLVEGSSHVDHEARGTRAGAGASLRSLVEEHGRSVVGARARPGPDGVLRFPLLVKLIDAGDDLSVQVHPDEAWARAHPGCFAKDEAWLVVHAEPGAQVLHGLKEGVDRAAFERAIAAGRVHELLRAVRVSAGDVLRIRPGTFHAVGRGCLLLEVQEPSDTTFRVWDYDRRDDSGRARPLHVEEALAVGRFGAQDPPLVGDAVPGAVAVETPLYAMQLVALAGGAARAVPRSEGEPAVVFVLEGEAVLRAEGDDAVTVPAGGSALVVAAAPVGAVRMEAPSSATLVVLSTGV
jgi:mannose-6-phosphate isomerase